MEKKTEVKERKNFNKICSILINVLVVPVVVIAFICAVFMTSAKANNKVPSIFGNSIVKVMSDSMDVPGGYKKGDVLIINQSVNLDKLAVGDCIAFYAPKQSGFTYDNGDSLIIFHRIVRIITVKETVEGSSEQVNIRYFVCHGDAASGVTYIPTLAKSQNKPQSEWGGDYTYNEESDSYELKAGGGYVVKLFDDDYVATGENEVASSQSLLQYVTDEYVVGILKSRANGLLSGLVSFCCSEAGIILLVIIPSMVMIVLVVSSLVQEAKKVKEAKEAEQLAMAQNISKIGSQTDVDEETTQKQQEEKQELKNSEKMTQEVKDKVDNKADDKQIIGSSEKPTEEQQVKVKPQDIPVKKQHNVAEKKATPVVKKVPEKIAPSKPVQVPKPSTNVDKTPAKAVSPKTQAKKTSSEATQKPKTPAKAPLKAPAKSNEKVEETSKAKVPPKKG